MSINVDNVLLLEEPILRVPYESMRKTFKQGQKNIERESQYLTISVGELAGMSPSDALAKLEEMTKRIKGLKRKLSCLKAEQEELNDSTRARIDHLTVLSSNKDIEMPKFNEWSKKKLDILLTDYFMRSGYVKTGELHFKNRGIEKLVDTNVLMECSRIEHSLLDQTTDNCLNWCQENRAYLKKVHSGLEFELRLQQFIELVRSGKTLDAISYYRKHLIKSADTRWNDIQKAAALLAFDSKTSVEKYRELYSNERWSTLASIFVSTFYELHGVPSHSTLVECLATGISSLKTYSCVNAFPEESTNEETSTTLLSSQDVDFKSTKKVDLSRASMCPVCSAELNTLSHSLPFALHVRSHLDSDPVMLPNGRIYGEQKLTDYSKKAGLVPEKVVDPVSLEVFQVSELTHVYPS